MKSRGYRFAVRWIAAEDEPTELDAEAMHGQLTVALETGLLTAEGAATVRRMMAEPEHLPATRRICTTCHGQRMTVGERGPKVCDACNGDGVEVLA